MHRIGTCYQLHLPRQAGDRLAAARSVPVARVGPVTGQFGVRMGPVAALAAPLVPFIERTDYWVMARRAEVREAAMVAFLVDPTVHPLVAAAVLSVWQLTAATVDHQAAVWDHRMAAVAACFTEA